MKKNVSFMRKDVYDEKHMENVIKYLEPLFENDNKIFKEMLKEGLCYLESKHFTYILNPAKKEKYRIMGNCIGPMIYVRDILSINDPDTSLLEEN